MCVICHCQQHIQIVLELHGLAELARYLIKSKLWKIKNWLEYISFPE